MLPKRMLVLYIAYHMYSVDDTTVLEIMTLWDESQEFFFFERREIG